MQIFFYLVDNLGVQRGNIYIFSSAVWFFFVEIEFRNKIVENWK